LVCLPAVAPPIRRRPRLRKDRALAPTGKLRLGFLANNAVHASVEPLTGELKGPAVDLGWALARRLGVPFETVTYKTVKEMVGSVSRNDWDVISIGINPDRQTLMNFSAPYSQIEIGILVGKDSPVTSMASSTVAGFASRCWSEVTPTCC